MQNGQEIADFIQKHSPARRRFELAFLLVDRPCKRAALVAEEFRLKEGFWNHAAIDRHERPLAPRATRMNRMGRDLLAGTRFAGH